MASLEDLEVEIERLDKQLAAIQQLEDDGAGYVSESEVDDIQDGDLPQQSDDMGNVVCIDNFPIVGESKHRKLTSVIRKICSNFGSVDSESGLFMPMNPDTGKTYGFAFVEYETPQQAKKALLNMQDWRFDKRHKLTITPYNELSQLASMHEEYEEPPAAQFKRRDDLYWWLQDDKKRDQFVIRQAKNTEVFWIEGPQLHPPDMCYDGPSEQKAQGKTWCEMQVEWSPQGLYLATFHPQGLILWGGPGWRRVQRFAHKRVWKVQFSPMEKFLITWNGSEEPREKSVIIWDVRSGKRLREMTYNPEQHGAWPCFKWSHGDTMFARKGENVISVYSTPTCKLLDKRGLRAPNVKYFDWSPRGYNMRTGSVMKEGGTAIIAYWAPESGNTPFQVRMVQMPTREEVACSNLFEVKSCEFHWQNAGEYLCAQVTRHSKTRRTEYTNFELFRMNTVHQSVAIEHLEQRQRVVAFEWEPNSSRFAYIYGDGAQRLNVDFYTMGNHKVQKLEKLYSLENKQCNLLYWSPMGNILVLAGLFSMNGQLEFWDTDNQLSMSTQEHFMCNHISWDPSGRVVCSAVCRPMFEGGDSMRYTLENGFNLWTFQGAPMHKEPKKEFYSFSWRPRPGLLLSAEEQQEVRRNLKRYIHQFEQEDLRDRHDRLRRRVADLNEKYARWQEGLARRSQVAQNLASQRVGMGLVVEREEDYEIVEDVVEVEIDVQEEIIS